jgi:hypothetical protein
MIQKHQALAITHADAERAYRDLSPYRITIALEADGWHVEYELTEPLTAGGGPRYVIDSRTGEILSRKYYQ